MSEPNREEISGAPETFRGPIQDRALRPPGVLPKNTQTYVILGIAVVMAGAIAFSGAGTPTRQSALPAAKTQPVVDPNWARIQDYRNRIDEQARKLAAEQAQLEQAKRALGLPPPVARLGTAPQALPSSSYGRPEYPPHTYSAPEPRMEKSAIEADKEKREYQSLFASNIVLTYRKEGQVAVQPAPGAPSSTPSLPYGGIYYPMPLPSAPARSPSSPAGVQPQPMIAPQDNPLETTVLDREATSSAPSNSPAPHPQADDPTLKQADGKLYRLFEGTIIETVLTNRLNGSFNGPVNCMVTTDVYSHDRQHVLIPKGSRVLGEAKRNDAFGQQRLAVFFHRIIMPDGFSVNLDKFRGLNQIGETGVRDQVNHHYAQIFGISLAVGSIAGLANINTGYGFNASSADAYRQGVGASLSQSSLRILDRYLNVLPTFIIREGHRIKVVLSGDLELPALERHKMPSDL